MKILSAAQIKEADAITIAEEGIRSSELMERASLLFTNWFLKNFQPASSIWIFCGTGNNGGDGLCVARHLLQRGYNIHVCIVGDPDTGTEDLKLNLHRLIRSGYNHSISPNNLDKSMVKENDLFIDAIFGIGLNREPEGLQKEVIEFINSTGNVTISIDMPSGLFSEKSTNGISVHANYTLSFELPKLSFFFPENEKYTGHWEIKSIGLSKKYLAEEATNYFFLTGDMIRLFLHKRSRFGHKGIYGHSLIIAGNPGTEGAAELCAYACLAAGSGLVTLSHGNLNTEFPELMTINRDKILDAIQKNKFNVIGIGPGLGTKEKELIKSVLTDFQNPIVIDADALNTISENKELLQYIPQNSVLTPHPKEFERLFGKYESEDIRIKKQIEFSVEHKIILVYKRANSLITTPDGRCYFNSTGNAGMATAGSGDVLTGIITALLAQKYEPADAALLGVYLHGLAGDIAMMEQGGQNIVAEDLINYIPAAFELISS